MGTLAARRLYTPSDWTPEEGTPEQRELQAKARAMGLEVRGLTPLEGTLWRYSGGTLLLGKNKYEFELDGHEVAEPFASLGYVSWSTEERYTFYDDEDAVAGLSESFPGVLFVMEVLDEEGYRYVIYARDGQHEVVGAEVTFPSSTLCATLESSWKASL